MTVQEMIEVLQLCNPEDEVRIRASFTFNTVGPSPSTEISTVASGFDWDNGRVLIYSNANLIQLDEHQYSIFRQELYNHDRIRSMISKGLTPKDSIPPMFTPSGKKKDEK